MGRSGEVTFKGPGLSEHLRNAVRDAEIAAAPDHDEESVADLKKRITQAAKTLYPGGGKVDREELANEAGVSVGEIRKYWG